MGRRSRKRLAEGAEPRVEPAARPQRAQPQTRVDRFIARADERPKAPWHPFPLVELSVLAGIVLMVLGLLKADTRNGRTMLVFGLTLASLGGLDTAVREHYAGMRSHTLLLSGLPAVLVAAALYFLQLPWIVVILGALATLVGAFVVFRRAFKARSGVGFRV